MPPVPVSSTPSLTSLPPECLLAIISHLSPPSYSTLVHTSHHFLRFFSSHAATICNNYILTHFRASAFDLNSRYIDGWLVPSHPDIDIHQLRFLSSPAALRLSNGANVSLPEPGPQYMCLLIEYNFEIQVRRRMADGAHADKLDNVSYITDREKETEDQTIDLLEENSQDGVRAIREGAEESFAYMVGTYAIRPFLRKLDRFARDLEERRFEEASRRWDKRSADHSGHGVAFNIRKLTQRLKSEINELGRPLKKKVNGLCSRMKKGKQDLCFGEIQSGEDLPRHNSSGRTLVSKSHITAGLLWYYGDAGILAFRAREAIKWTIGSEKIEEKQEQVDGLAIQLGQGKCVTRVKLFVKKSLRAVGRFQCGLKYSKELSYSRVE